VADCIAIRLTWPAANGCAAQWDFGQRVYLQCLVPDVWQKSTNNAPIETLASAYTFGNRSGRSQVKRALTNVKKGDYGY
jgi:hypothetical protein